jgi:hypothetical protein
MKLNKIEMVFMVIAMIAVILSVSFIKVSALDLAKSQPQPSHYPHTHPSHPTPQAPANFPWDKMPDGHFPPPFTVPTTYPAPSQP